MLGVQFWNWMSFSKWAINPKILLQTKTGSNPYNVCVCVCLSVGEGRLYESNWNADWRKEGCTKNACEPKTCHCLGPIRASKKLTLNGTYVHPHCPPSQVKLLSQTTVGHRARNRFLRRWPLETQTRYFINIVSNSFIRIHIQFQKNLDLTSK